MTDGVLALLPVGLLAACSPAEPASATAPTTPEAATAPPAPPAEPPAPPAEPPAPAATAPAHVVAVGDLHGDLVDAIADLTMAGVTDASGHWAGGDLTLVQTGDLIDRGPDSKGVIELMMRLEKEAPAAGGRVVALIGNHEVMNVAGDWRYVSAEDLAGFGGEDARKAAFALTGDIGRWILTHDAVAQLGDTVYLHGGVSARYAPRGVAALTLAVRRAIAGGDKEILGDEGPLWYRGYLLNDEALACAELDQALPALGARRMVVGHTTQKDGHIAARCGGRLLGIDTGISAVYGVHLAALDIRDGDARAIYPQGALDLPDP